MCCHGNKKKNTPNVYRKHAEFHAPWTTNVERTSCVMISYGLHTRPSVYDIATCKYVCSGVFRERSRRRVVGRTTHTERRVYACDNVVIRDDVFGGITTRVRYARRVALVFTFVAVWKNCLGTKKKKTQTPHGVPNSQERLS